MALKKIVLTKLKTVEFTPIPTDNERTATRVNPGFLSSMRIPNRTSFRKDSISTSIVSITGCSVTLDRVEAGPIKRGFLTAGAFLQRRHSICNLLGLGKYFRDQLLFNYGRESGQRRLLKQTAQV